ncbi:MAG: ACT domain-containing protein, partial [Candidatus Methanomethylophilaceae archaeon]|nr:ACT domain-containing protein [Candidatus Methanomethylophilaceae archaeon]
LVLEGGIMLARYRDTPGTIGAIGKVLGDNGINIATMAVGRDVPRGTAVMALSVDSPIPEEVLRKVDVAAGFDDSKYAFIE